MTLALNERYEMSGGDAAALLGEFGGGQTTLCIEAGWSQSVLRSLRAGSAGVVIMISGYGPYLPCVGTSSSIFDSRLVAVTGNTRRPPRAVLEHDDVLAIAVGDQVREVLAALSVNKSQLANVLGVSRPTLYEWFSGKEPNPANAQRLSTILRLLVREGVRGSYPLNARFVRLPLADREPSLLEALCERNLNEDRITQLIRDARALEHAAESRRRVREARLGALGYDEPSGEQQKEQLARNIAARDWPNE